MPVLPTISLGSGLIPPIGALIGTMGANHVVGAITNTGTPLDWSQYDQSKLSSVMEFHRTVIQPVSQAVTAISNANISTLRDELAIPLVNVAALHNPTIMLRDVIMSIPEVTSLAQDGRVWGYGLPTQMLDVYADSGRPYELMTMDLGTPILPAGHGFHNTHDDLNDDMSYSVSTTVVSGNQVTDDWFNNLTDRQLSSIDDAIYRVREMLHNTLIDPTAPDNDRG